eukprot:gnl/Spiro4/18239_TR9750_c0_g1_i1.p1 gnl/Spiro4/18239_TR9750_c0_g1~~gnl/Spiro4/18239_TR9750_c0_g1_i1.p1  ORF type:complete len:435 (+),score=108.87 gnl/Spiro4/18239_TR9750_c0_g1_i1:31-1305(+)
MASWPLPFVCLCLVLVSALRSSKLDFSNSAPSDFVLDENGTVAAATVFLEAEVELERDRELELTRIEKEIDRQIEQLRIERKTQHKSPLVTGHALERATRRNKSPTPKAAEPLAQDLVEKAETKASSPPPLPIPDTIPSSISPLPVSDAAVPSRAASQNEKAGRAHRQHRDRGVTRAEVSRRRALPLPTDIDTNSLLAADVPFTASYNPMTNCNPLYEVCCWNGDVACRSYTWMQEGKCPHATTVAFNGKWDNSRQCCSISDHSVAFCPDGTGGSPLGCCSSESRCRSGKYDYMQRQCNYVAPPKDSETHQRSSSPNYFWFWVMMALLTVLVVVLLLVMIRRKNGQNPLDAIKVSAANARDAMVKAGQDAKKTAAAAAESAKKTAAAAAAAVRKKAEDVAAETRRLAQLARDSAAAALARGKKK